MRSEGQKEQSSQHKKADESRWGELRDPSTPPGLPPELAGPDEGQGRGDGALGLEKVARAAPHRWRKGPHVVVHPRRVWGPVDMRRMPST